MLADLILKISLREKISFDKGALIMFSAASRPRIISITIAKVGAMTDSVSVWLFAFC